MSTTTEAAGAAPRASGTWLNHWEPEDARILVRRGQGPRLADPGHHHLRSDAGLHHLVRRQRAGRAAAGLGFQLTTASSFWLAAMPGLAGGTFASCTPS